MPKAKRMRRSNQNTRRRYPVRISIGQLSRRARRTRSPEHLCGTLSRLFSVRKYDSIEGLTCRSGVAFRKQRQFGFGDSEFRSSTIQTDNKLRKHPRDGLVDVFQSGKMDGHLRGELALVD